MNELFPIAAGVAVALLTRGIASARARAAVVAVLAVVLGFVASLISGELELSWGFVPVDIVFVLLAAVATVTVLGAWERRATLGRGQ